MRLLFLLLTLTLLSCASDMNVKNFENEKPRFVLEDYFDGKTKAWGMFHDRFGNLKRSFKVDITGTLDNDTLTLDEKFVYNDGEKESRIWSIKILGNNKYPFGGTKVPVDPEIGSTIHAAIFSEPKFKAILSRSSASSLPVSGCPLTNLCSGK